MHIKYFWSSAVTLQPERLYSVNNMRGIFVLDMFVRPVDPLKWINCMSSFQKDKITLFISEHGLPHSLCR